MAAGAAVAGAADQVEEVGAGGHRTFSFQECLHDLVSSGLAIWIARVGLENVELVDIADAVTVPIILGHALAWVV
jgi:hypothetical protein